MKNKVIAMVYRFLNYFRLTNFVDPPVVLQSKRVFWSAIFLLSLVATLITSFSFHRLPKSPLLGTIAASDLKADRDYDIVDDEATSAVKEDVRRSILPVYHFDQQIAADIANRVELAFEEARQIVLRDSAKKNEIRKDLNQMRHQFEENLGVQVTNVEWEALVQERFSIRLAKFISNAVLSAMKLPIVESPSILEVDRERGILVVRSKIIDGRRVSGQETKVENISTVPILETVRDRVTRMAIPPYTVSRIQHRAPVLDLVANLIAPNCFFDHRATEERQMKAVTTVKDVVIRVAAGEMIIRDGSRFEPWHLKVIKGMQKDKEGWIAYFRLAGSFIVIFFAIILPFYFSSRFLRRFRPTYGDYLLMVTIGIVTLVLLRISLSVSNAIQQSLIVTLPDRALMNAVPFAAGAMLVRLLLTSEAALMFSVPFAICCGLFPETGLRFTAFALLSQFAAIAASSRIDRRTLIFRVGLIVGIVGAAILMSMKLISQSSLGEVHSWGGLFSHAILGFCGGMTTAFVVMIALPVIESLTGYVTEIKLLELANLNHPLLRELVVRAPGTYHHSHLVGILSEAAAEAIGANALLVRVGAYYHDIGKIKKPSYFIENSTEENRHEKLTPHMSAMIVGSHVKEGMEMATKAGLPKAIVDMIPEHHGTRMIGFFFEKAKSQLDPEMEKVAASDYRYPGPKPQSRETAIMMLADITEAAVRALKEKTSVRIQQTVDRAINDVFTEAQLDESDLTLKDLNEIGKAFVRILMGIYHQRIEYPRDREAPTVARTEINVVNEDTGVIHH
ncbi:MAG: HDIG domain-containing protein [Deltaproteobacteria bacterium]|nr:HDIG domain-containing protein [Deltaproteobacteria bacterium]